MTLRAISYAVLQDYHQQKRSNPSIPTLDLSNCDLRHFDLRDLDLSGTDLSKADLTGVLLDRANLRGATLYKTRLANISLGTLLATGIEPVDLLQQHRGATYYLLRLFHFAPLPEHEHMFELTNEECARICQFHANLLWQDLDNQAVISALYPGGVWEDWLLDMLSLRPVLDWVMSHPESLPVVRSLYSSHWNDLFRSRLREASQTQEMAPLLALLQNVVAVQMRDEQLQKQHAAKEAEWLTTPVVYPSAPWPDSSLVRQIKSRQELIAVLQTGRPFKIASHDVMDFEYECLEGISFLYHVREPGSKELLVAILQDGSVWWIKKRALINEQDGSEPEVAQLPDGGFTEATDPLQEEAPLLAWLRSWGSPQNDFSPLGRACYLLSKAGIAKLIYQIYWYSDEDKMDVQACRDEQGQECSSDNPAIWQAHWVLHYASQGRGYYGRYELSVPEKRLVRLGDAQVPELEEDDVFYEETEE